jgi:hypothetical protein
MALSKKLETGTVIKAWNYDEGNTVGMSVAAKNGNTGVLDALLHIESVKCAEGVVNRLVIKRETAEKLGWTIIEE